MSVIAKAVVFWLIVPLVFFSIESSAASPATTENFVVDGVEIQIRSVIVFDAKRGQSVYEITLDYQAKRPVIVAGLKTAVGNGMLKYIATEPKLVLSDVNSGAKLAEFALHITATPAGNPTKDLPDPADLINLRQFDTDFKDAEDVERTINSVLNRYFTQGLWPQTWKSRPYRIITPYRGLENLPWPYRGKVAIELEFPVETSSQHHGFRLAWTASESRIAGSAWIKADSKEVLGPAQAFIDQLLREMQK